MTARMVPVATTDRRYDVHIDAGLLGRTVPLLDAGFGDRPRNWVLDREAMRAHGPHLMPLIGTAPHLEFTGGEAAKTLHGLETVLRHLATTTPWRNMVLHVVGGGAVGDLGGLAAALFLRGIEYVLIPTTLLAMVDQSVGGKTAVDLPEGKNLVGAFHQPSLVLADLHFLHTLPQRELLSGLGEVVKCAIGFDADLFTLLERHHEQVLARDEVLLGEIVERCVRIKAQVVGRDARESGERRLLNLGHTLGHALEAALDYNGIRHGEAVAVGLRFCGRVALAHKRIDRFTAQRIETLMDQLGLPAESQFQPDLERLGEFMRRDKKADRDRMRLVLPSGLGSCEVVEAEPAEVIRRAVDMFV